MQSMTAILAEYSYSELIDLHGELTRVNPEHELIAWVEQELEIREEQMRWAMNEMYLYAQSTQD